MTAQEGNDPTNLKPSTDALRAIYDAKYKDSVDLGWGPRTRLRFGHFSADEHYEAVVASLARDGMDWADIGCGRDVFPSNPGLAEVLAKKANYVLGIDPDDNIRDNPHLSEAFQGLVESCETDKSFDLITMRMVAEHVEHPEAVAGKLAELCRTDGNVVIFTPNKWAPMSILARVTSLKVHHFFKKLLWETEERDTFPIQYKLNTRNDLQRHFESAGFEMVHFQYLDDCRTFNRFRILNFMELVVWKILSTLRLHYPETCLLVVFRRK